MTRVGSQCHNKKKTVTEISLPYGITIRLHCCDANTSLFQKEKENKMNP